VITLVLTFHAVSLLYFCFAPINGNPRGRDTGKGWGFNILQETKCQNPHPWYKACGQKFQNFPHGANVTSVYKSQDTHNMSKVPDPGVGIQCQNAHPLDSQESQIPTLCLGPLPLGLTLIGVLRKGDLPSRESNLVLQSQ
jgi:hypothetical protein